MTITLLIIYFVGMFITAALSTAFGSTSERPGWLLLVWPWLWVRGMIE